MLTYQTTKRSKCTAVKPTSSILTKSSDLKTFNKHANIPKNKNKSKK